MKACPQEAAVLEAVNSGEWPTGLRQHSNTCPVCREVAEVARIFSEDYTAVLSEVRVPPAALVWWRSEIEARQEAARNATRPITLIHALAVACGLGVAVALGRTLIPQGSGMVRQWLADLSAVTAGVQVDQALTAATGPFGFAAIVAIGCCLVAAPLAAYFIFSDD